jgi:hypothetical protein
MMWLVIQGRLSEGAQNETNMASVGFWAVHERRIGVGFVVGCLLVPALEPTIQGTLVGVQITVKMTTDLHLMARLRMHGAVPPPPQLLLAQYLTKHGDGLTFNFSKSKDKRAMDVRCDVIWNKQVTHAPPLALRLLAVSRGCEEGRGQWQCPLVTVRPNVVSHYTLNNQHSKTKVML